jgi:hypothetical protein
MKAGRVSLRNRELVKLERLRLVMAKQSNIPGLTGWDGAAKAWAAYWLVVVLGILACCQQAFWHFKAEGWFGKHLTVLPFTVALLAISGAIFWVPWLIDRRRTNAVATLANDLVAICREPGIPLSSTQAILRGS